MIPLLNHLCIDCNKLQLVFLTLQRTTVLITQKKKKNNNSMNTPNFTYFAKLSTSNKKVMHTGFIKT